MFRFTIRDLLWLMTVLGLLLAWWVSWQWTEPPQAAPQPQKLTVRLGQNHFEAEGNSEVVKEQYSMFLNAVFPPPPTPPEPTEGDTTTLAIQPAASAAGSAVMNSARSENRAEAQNATAP